MIRFEDVTKKFSAGTAALNKVSFEIDEGEFVFLVGPSGAGKTTVIRLITRELIPTEGKVFVFDKNFYRASHPEIVELRRKIGVVFQDLKLLMDRTVFENVSLVLEILGKEEEKIKKDVQNALKIVGLAEKENFFPIQLSLGELQRVSLARAIVGNPQIILADEPTGNLDPKTAWEIIGILKELNKDGKTVLMATHNADIVDSLKKRVIVLEKGKIKRDEKEAGY